MKISQYDFNLLKLCFWITIILGVLKLTNAIDVSIFIVFLPIILGVGYLFLLIFLIGLITVYLVDKEMNSDDGDSDSDEIIKES